MVAPSLWDISLMSDDSNGLLNFTFSYKIDSGKMYTIPVGFQGNEPCFAKKLREIIYLIPVWTLPYLPVESYRKRHLQVASDCDSKLTIYRKKWIGWLTEFTQKIIVIFWSFPVHSTIVKSMLTGWYSDHSRWSTIRKCSCGEIVSGTKLNV